METDRVPISVRNSLFRVSQIIAWFYTPPPLQTLEFGFYILMVDKIEEGQI
jgi:hypothetical protein